MARQETSIEWYGQPGLRWLHDLPPELIVKEILPMVDAKAACKLSTYARAFVLPQPGLGTAVPKSINGSRGLCVLLHPTLVSFCARPRLVVHFAYYGNVPDHIEGTHDPVEYLPPDEFIARCLRYRGDDVTAQVRRLVTGDTLDIQPHNEHGHTVHFGNTSAHGLPKRLLVQFSYDNKRRRAIGSCCGHDDRILISPTQVSDYAGGGVNGW